MIRNHPVLMLYVLVAFVALIAFVLLTVCLRYRETVAFDGRGGGGGGLATTPGSTIKSSMLGGSGGEGMSMMYPTEHGWYMRHVTATRYANQAVGYNVGFSFRPDYCDRKEIVDYFESRGGWVFQTCRSLGGETFVRFEGVEDRASADVKVKAILPGLNRLVATMAGTDLIVGPLPKENTP